MPTISQLVRKGREQIKSRSIREPDIDKRGIQVLLEQGSSRLYGVGRFDFKAFTTEGAAHGF